jgi:hypothetical protein
MARTGLRVQLASIPHDHARGVERREQHHRVVFHEERRELAVDLLHEAADLLKDAESRSLELVALLAVRGVTS